MRELIEIKSRDNEKLKFARRVRDGKDDDFMFVEGARLCGECLRTDTDIEFGLVSSDFDRLDYFNSRTMEREFPLFSVSEKLLDSVADTKRPQGIVLIAKRPNQISIEALFDRLDSRLPVIASLHQINNPSNLGAVIRTAEAAGIAGVIIASNSTDAYSPKSLRASMGSAFRLPVVTNVEINEVIETAHARDTQVAAVDLSGTIYHSDYDWKQKTLLVFGSEADGLSEEILSVADTKLKIEMNNEVESLNLAVSCGIVLFEARRQLTDSRLRLPKR